MALVYFAAVATESAEQACMAALHQYCGIPPYAGNECTQCAIHMEKALESHQCTVPMARCTLLNRILHSRMELDPTPAGRSSQHACGQ
jgi:hypothetical protein